MEQSQRHKCCTVEQDDGAQVATLEVARAPGKRARGYAGLNGAYGAQWRSKALRRCRYSRGACLEGAHDSDVRNIFGEGSCLRSLTMRYQRIEVTVSQ